MVHGWTSQAGLRAPVQKKRPSGAPTAAPPAPETFPVHHPPVPVVPVGRGRAKRLRSRLVIGVGVVALVVAGAGAPGIMDSSADLHESQRLVTLAELNRQAVTLAHSLADERDEITAYISAGRDDQQGDEADQRKVTATRSARVDRQIEEIRGSIPTERAALRRELSTVPSLRRTALTGKGSAMEAHQAYTDIIGSLNALSDELAEKTPPRAAHGTRAPASLGQAVEQASATRGLLLAALAVPGGKPEKEYDPYTGRTVQRESDDQKAAAGARDALSAAAQQAQVRAEAALADFDQAANKAARDSLAATVTGAEVKAAEEFLARLTDRPELSDSELETDHVELAAALTARIEQMRGVESALATQRITSLEQLRDDDVTALEVRVAILGALLLLSIAVLAALLRTITRPLAVLRLGAARVAGSPELEEPVTFTGRNDEFAQVVRSLNTLHGRVRELAARAETLDESRRAPAADRATDIATGTATGAGNDSKASADAARLAAELAAERAESRRTVDELTSEVERLRHSVDHTFVNLSLRTLGLVERQLSVIEKLEEREQDPERLATLFKLDHMATVMRRHSENLLVLAGAEHSHGHPGAVPLVDVLRAAVSEIERYERVVIQSLPPHAQVAGFAADDLSHLIAELLENATSFSPPDAQVELSGWLLENGEVMLSVQDSGIGMSAARLVELNGKLEDPAGFETWHKGRGKGKGKAKGRPQQSGKAGSGQSARTRSGKSSTDAEGLGLRVTALLAARHGVRVQLRDGKHGGLTAVIVLPQPLLPKEPPAEARNALTDSGTMPAVQLPGSVAEANSNALPTTARTAVPIAQGTDPLVEAAEAAVRAAEPEVHGRVADGGDAAGAIDEPTFEMRLPSLPAAASDDHRTSVRPDRGHHQHVPHDQHVRNEEYTAVDETGAARSGDTARPTEPVAAAGRDAPTGSARPAAPVGVRVTDKGLPKRTPRVVKPAEPTAGRKGGGLDADALRRKLGGFQRAAEDGRREARAEIARTTAPEEAGDTVEEARS
ncbi:nitrate- and nitrite sensing domain-containing protein [Streptomyces sp. NPDC047315]|uniref:sensor histidine kinase n=1 Tax=Streptomyces sp. NPDC047315 TaxID=3155142 RepID=UPI00340B8F95